MVSVQINKYPVALIEEEVNNLAFLEPMRTFFQNVCIFALLRSTIDETIRAEYRDAVRLLNPDGTGSSDLGLFFVQRGIPRLGIVPSSGRRGQCGGCDFSVG